ncbi:hypothetical protein T4E_8382 [Trichinella pseudospiralis]|uniref:FLYWCH-type domain-containing protein n=1 Tax=Trichinella pseudospiralis TaxID=6337 RepID=A0A0V0XKA4_TRIPS|nr:hypothetical protein T4E_8382 [Trichinella pseudospiralis]
MADITELRLVANRGVRMSLGFERIAYKLKQVCKQKKYWRCSRDRKDCGNAVWTDVEVTAVINQKDHIEIWRIDEHLANRMENKTLLKERSVEVMKPIPAKYHEEGSATSTENSTSGEFLICKRALLTARITWGIDDTFKVVPQWNQHPFTIYFFGADRLVPAVYCLCTVEFDEMKNITMVANHGELSLEVHPHSRAICIFLKLEMRIKISKIRLLWFCCVLSSESARGGEAAMVATPTSEAKNAQARPAYCFCDPVAGTRQPLALCAGAQTPRITNRLGDTFVLSHSNVGGRNTLVAAVLGYLGIRNANLIKYRIRSSADIPSDPSGFEAAVV